MPRPYDVIVAGVGGMGSAACYHLARRGVRVLGLERHAIGHALGSSHGGTRIIRLAYFAGDFYVPLLRRALDLWRETGAAFGEPLMVTTGGLDISSEDGAVFAGSLASCRNNGLPHEVLTAADVNRRFPGYALPGHLLAVFQPDAGFVLSERAIAAHVALAEAEGAEIRTGEAVAAWEVTAGGVRVTTERGTYEAGRLILTPGAWIADLVPEVAALSVAERQVVGWFQPKAPALFAPNRFPVGVIEAGDGRDVYAVPDYAGMGMKFGIHRHFREQGHPDTMQRATTKADEAALRALLGAYFPEADGPARDLRTCIYTMTPDEHFIIDTLPGHPEVVIASPCSGHGYKFAPVVGEILADLATTGTTEFDLGAFRLGRFAS